MMNFSDTAITISERMMTLDKFFHPLQKHATKFRWSSHALCYWWIDILVFREIKCEGGVGIQVTSNRTDWKSEVQHKNHSLWFQIIHANRWGIIPSKILPTSYTLSNVISPYYKMVIVLSITVMTICWCFHWIRSEALSTWSQPHSPNTISNKLVYLSPVIICF